MRGEIIEKLEQATGLDRRVLRELDREIDLAINPTASIWSPEWYSGGKDEYLRWPDPKPGVADYRQVKRYTTSVDVALTLLPEGWWLQHLGDNLAGWGARIETQGISIPESTRLDRSATAPLAVCLVALKARSARSPQMNDENIDGRSRHHQVRQLGDLLARARAERDGERKAREQCEAALREKDRAMGVLFKRLAKAGVDVSDLIP